MGREHPLLPILAAFAGIGLLALMDAFMKGAALALGAYSASLLRSAFALVFALPVWLATGARRPPAPVLRIHLLRGVVASIMALAFFYALTKLPIAETIAISFVAPLVALWLAAIMLGETIHRRAIWAAVLGLIGTLIIVGGRIGQERMTPDAAMGLAAILFSALLYAWNLVLMRRQATLAPPLEVTVFHAGMGVIVLGLFAPWLFELATPAAIPGVAIAGALTACGSLVLAWAYARAEAQILVPIEYSGFLWASLFGWLFFAEIVRGTTILGAMLIVVGCWIGARRNEPEQARV
ncbi:EamA family transporter [Erythrobacter sp. 3-20A1M]|uniref:DMT family transporter n=1 Tax=Erythrobacter sp. 3-20A1M TaxID=2653850 RepID=UPI001BFC5DE3|nr:DMT family transporter [Erythrobacter sp. 3-20A1M]QWC57095.1 EamA family transporter [Erythrobacter sp. 3-20A1M]